MGYATVNSRRRKKSVYCWDRYQRFALDPQPTLWDGKACEMVAMYRELDIDMPCGSVMKRRCTLTLPRVPTDGTDGTSLDD